MKKIRQAKFPYQPELGDALSKGKYQVSKDKLIDRRTGKEYCPEHPLQVWNRQKYPLGCYLCHKAKNNYTKVPFMDETSAEDDSMTLQPYEKEGEIR